MLGGASLVRRLQAAADYRETFGSSGEDYREARSASGFEWRDTGQDGRLGRLNVCPLSRGQLDR